MSRPVDPNPKKYTDTIVSKRWDGRYYVMERVRQYCHRMQNYKQLSSKVLGVIEHKDDPIESMVPIEEWNKRRQEEKEARKQAKIQAEEMARKEREKKQEAAHELEESKKLSIAAPSIVDTRQLERVAFPAQCLFLVVLAAFCSGYTDCQSSEAFYNARMDEFRKLFRGFPKSNITHDTVRRFIILLGKDQNNRLLSLFNELLLAGEELENVLNELSEEEHEQQETQIIENALDDLSEEEHELQKTRIIAADGQAVRATKLHPGSKHSRSVLSFYDCQSGMVLEQAVVGKKTNEIPHALQILEKIDVSGAVITADALHAQYGFVKEIMRRGGDYVMPIKKNQALTEANIKELFSKYGQDSKLVKANEKCDFGHGRVEERKIRVLPGNLLEEKILDKWCMLKEGCIAELTTTMFNKSTGKEITETRFYISSLKYDKKYIQKQLMHIIRSHWNIESKLHWVLDVVYSQDRTQCKNNEFFKGKTLLMKMVYNFVEVAQRIEEKSTGKPISKSALKAKLSDFSYFFKMYCKTLGKSGN